MTLAELIASMPGETTATDAQVLAWLQELLPIPRTVSVVDVRNYLTTQLLGSGAGQRSVLDAIREYAEDGTVAGSSVAEQAPAARRSGARMILEMLRHGGADASFLIDDANVAAQFTALGNDGGNGPGILSGAQLNAIAALATDQAPRWTTADVDWRDPAGGTETDRRLHDISVARQ